MSSHGQLVTGQLVTGQLVTYASRHSQLVTSEHITKQGYLVTTVICDRGNLKETRHCTYMFNTASHRRRQSSWMWRMLGQKVWSTHHNAVRHDGQLVTQFYNVTSWPCDELTGSFTQLIKWGGQRPRSALVRDGTGWDFRDPIRPV